MYYYTVVLNFVIYIAMYVPLFTFRLLEPFTTLMVAITSVLAAAVVNETA